MKSEIICIIDRSGSMAAIVNDAIGGFNTFLKAQKKIPDEATLTLIQFDNEYEVVHENKPLNKVPRLTSKTFVPRGSTALLDAIGTTIHNTERRLSNMPKSSLPDKVIVVILTDGEENASHEYSLKQINEMITHQKEIHKWEFIFLAANQDVFAEAAKLGIGKSDTTVFAATGEGVRKAYSSMTTSVTTHRTSNPHNQPKNQSILKKLFGNKK